MSSSQLPLETSTRVGISSRPVRRWAVGSLWANLVVAGLMIVADVAHVLLLWRTSMGPTVGSEPLFEAYDWTVFILGEAGGYVFFFAAICFVIWFTRSFRILHVLGVRGFDYSWRLVTGAFFIPLLNLVMPYAIARDIWKASDPSCDDPVAWKGSRVSRRLTAWWAAYLGMTTGMYLVYKYLPQGETSYSVWYAYMGLSIVTSAMTIIAGLLAISIVRGIDARQDEKHHRIASLPSE
jgi:hypothetical protein